MDDVELVRQALQGNKAAYGRLIERFTAQIAALCRAHVRQRDAVEDLTQDTFLRGLEKLDTLREPGSFGYWLYTIARNLCREWLADPQRRHVSLSANPPEVRDRAAAAPADERADRFHSLRECLRHLPEELRETLEIYYSSRITYQELAERQGVSFALVNQRLTRARRLLRACLEREDTTTS